MAENSSCNIQRTVDTKASKLRMVGYENFKRVNTMSDKFPVLGFHHIEFYCADANSMHKRFAWGLGMQLVAKSNQQTHNANFASYVLQSEDLVFVLTAPYSDKTDKEGSKNPVPWFDSKLCRQVVQEQAFGVRSIGVIVEDAKVAYETATKNGAKGILEPVQLKDEATGETQTVAEVHMYGHVVMRFVSGSFKGPYLCGYTPVESGPNKLSCGLNRLDHAVGSVEDMLKTAEHMIEWTGFHQFVEFTHEDVGTNNSGVNAMVIANNDERVLFTIVEPTYDTPLKSQIQMYLEQNEGPGVHHLAVMTDDIVATVKEMRKRAECGGFELFPSPTKEYYANLPKKMGNMITEQKYREIEELGILADKDEKGVLLQILSMPISDRPTIFFEIIERIGCMNEVKDPRTGQVKLEQAGGCGGFGKGNFGALFAAMEAYEKSIKV